MQTLLNLGCNCFKIHGLINIDLDPKFKPDMILDITKLTTEFEENSVDFINAGHIFEHLPYKDSLESLRQCHKILRPYRSIIVTVPDYSKCFDMPVEEAERIIMGGWEHKTLFNSARIAQILKEAGFRCTAEITDLSRVPYLIVPNINDPKPEPWQTAYIAMKT